MMIHELQLENRIRKKLQVKRGSSYKYLTSVNSDFHPDVLSS